MLTTTTDATPKNFDLVLLQDDKKPQNADNVLLPVVNAKDAGDQAIADALGKLTDTLSTDDLVELNRKVDAERHMEADVAKDYPFRRD